MRALLLLLLMPLASGATVIEDDAGDSARLDILSVTIEPTVVGRGDVRVDLADLQLADAGEVDVIWQANAPYGAHSEPRGVRFRLYPVLEVYELREVFDELDESIRFAAGERITGTPGALVAYNVTLGKPGAILTDFTVDAFSGYQTTPNVGGPRATAPAARGIPVDQGAGETPYTTPDGIPWAATRWPMASRADMTDSVDGGLVAVADIRGAWIQRNGTGFDAQVSLRALSVDAIAACESWSVKMQLSDRDATQWLTMETGLSTSTGYFEPGFRWGAHITNWSDGRDITGTDELDTDVRIVLGEPGYVQWHVQESHYTPSLEETPLDVMAVCDASKDRVDEGWSSANFLLVDGGFGGLGWGVMVVFVPGVLGLIGYVWLLRKTKE